MPNNKKISDFTQQQTYLSTDLLNIVRNSTNYSIPVSALPAFLGVTGTINVVGGSGTPVLEQPDATTNNIRTIEDGDGIIATVSALNGIEISHNFTQDQTGVLLVDDLATASPTFPSLLPGDGIEIARAADVITITATGALPATKTVTVNQEADFPAAVSGVITLEDETVYVISNNVTTANRFVLGDNVTITGYSFLGPLLEYTGSGTMFTGTDADSAFINLRVTAPLGKVWDVTRTTGFTGVFINNVSIVACDTVGTFNAMLAVNIQTLICINVATNGINFTGTFQTITVDDLELLSTNASFTAIDMGVAISDSITLSNLTYNGVSGGVGIDIAPNDANLTATGSGSVIGSNFIGAVTELVGGDVATDVQWQYANNQGIEDTMVDALLSMQGNATATVIASAGVGVLAAGTWVVEQEAQVTSTTAGRVTLNSKKKVRLPITASITIEPVSGGNTTVGCMIAIDGTVQTNSLRTATASSGNPTSITVPWQETLEETQYIEIFVTNEDATTNVLVSSALLRVN